MTSFIVEEFISSSSVFVVANHNNMQINIINVSVVSGGYVISDDIFMVKKPTTPMKFLCDY